MNLEGIKNGGVRLALETELNIQRQILNDEMKARKWGLARQAAENIIILLNELGKLDPKPTPR